MTFEDLIQQIELIQTHDDFTGDQHTYLSNLGVEGDNDHLPLYYEQLPGGSVLPIHIGLRFDIFNDHYRMHFTSNNDGMKLKKGDKMIFLFDDKSRFEFCFVEDSKFDGYLYENYHLISAKDLDEFFNKKVDKWKLANDKYFVVGDLSFWFELSYVQSKEVAQDLIQYMAKRMLAELLRMKTKNVN